LLFITLDEGNYLLNVTNPEGPCGKKKLPSFFYDPGLFFDEDGKTYVVYGIDEIRIAELDSNFIRKEGTDKLVFTYTFRKGLEGSHM
jgi:beta-xylosidase